MRLALHHFRKEALYVRTRWLLWLGLLALELAVHLEWVAPMTPEFQWEAGRLTPFWLGFLHPLVWGVALWLVASVAPEDRLGNSERFLGARPLPTRCYVMGRVMAFLVLIVAPFAAQEALYLIFSGRPQKDVWIGALEGGLKPIAWLGWWLPFSMLWKRAAETWGAIGLMAAGLLVSAFTPMFGTSASRLRLTTEPDPFPGRYMAGVTNGLHQPAVALLGAALLVCLLWLHLRSPWRLRWRMTAVTVLALGIGCLAFSFTAWNFATRPLAQQEVEALGAKVQTSLSGYEFDDYADELGLGHGVWVKGFSKGYPAQFTPHWRRQEVTIERDGDTIRTFRSYSPGFFSAFTTWMNIPVQDAFSSFLPKDTVLRCESLPSRRGIDAGRLVIPDAWRGESGPLRVQGRYAIDWLKWEHVADLPLVVGSTATSEDSKWTILGVEPGRTPFGENQSGILCVTLRLEHRQQRTGAQPWDWPETFIQMLHVPAKEMASASLWRGNDTQRAMLVTPHVEAGSRAENTTWQRRTVRLAWPDILTPDGPVSPDETRQLRMVVLKRSYAGTSFWEGPLPDMKLPQSNNDLALTGDTVQESEVLQARLKALPPLREGASLEEAEAYLADLFDALGVMNTLPASGSGESELWLEAMRPLARLHPTLLLQVKPTLLWPVMLGRLATSEPALRDAIVTELPKRPWLGMIMRERPEWNELLRARADQLMKTVPASDVSFVVEMFMSWRDPSHVPWLLGALEQSKNADLYLYCRTFPEHREAADATARRIYVEAFGDRHLQFTENAIQQLLPPLTVGLRAGMPEALHTTLRLARAMTSDQRKTLLLSDRMPGCFGKPPAAFQSEAMFRDLMKWVETFPEFSPEDFRFDEAARIWVTGTTPAAGSASPPPR